MPFQPLNDDHAIQAVGFALGLTKPLPWSMINSVLASPLDWRRELPALELTQTMELQLNPQTGQPVNRIMRGAQFSHKRPDGSSSWQLDVLGSEIRIMSTLYTRWDPTWEKAGDILMGVAGQLGQLAKEGDFRVNSIGLLVVDVFSTEDEPPDYTELLIANSRDIASRVLNVGKFWHSHTGWFNEQANGRVLNQLNIDARTGGGENSIPGIPDDRTRVVVQHNQVFRPAEPIELGADKDLEDALFAEMPSMHSQNKLMLRSILTPEMQKRIKVDV